MKLSGSFQKNVILAWTLQVAIKHWTMKAFFFSEFVGPCIASVFAEYNQKDATFHTMFISVWRSTCFRRFFRPSSGAQNCTYSVRYLSDRYCHLPLACLPAGSSIGLTNTWNCMCNFEFLMMDGKTRLKHVERLTEINKLWTVASCWLYSVNILTMHGPVNVKLNVKYRLWLRLKGVWQYFYIEWPVTG